MILHDKHSLLFCESVQDQWGLVQIKPVHILWGETPDKLCILVHFSFNTGNSNFLNGDLTLCFPYLWVTLGQNTAQIFFLLLTWVNLQELDHLVITSFYLY